MRSLLLGILSIIALIAYPQRMMKFTVDGKNREALVYAPSNRPSNPALVISLHGANQDAYYQQNQTHWNECADTAKCVVVYPNAINKFWDVNGKSDIHFIETIIERMEKTYHVNPSRIYVTGFSLGAMMTYHCIEHLGDKIAAFGPVSGVRFDNRAPVAPRNVPIIHTHGTGDDVFKWVGDLGHAAGGYPYIPDYVEKWANYQNLTVKEEIKPYPKSKPYSIATLTVWTSSDPSDSVRVCLLAIKDKGHWHSEDINAGVSTTQEIWRFCSSYSLPDASAIIDIEADEYIQADQKSDISYNVYGQPVDDSYKGLVIKNGKKYLKF